jgi:hypothetical protein
LITTSTSQRDPLAIASTISSVNLAIEAARAERKAQVRAVALDVLTGERELPETIHELEELLVVLHELQVAAEYAELKAVIDASPSRLALLTEEWHARQADLEKARAGYYAAASELRLPHHEHWDACEPEFESEVDLALAALSGAREACVHEMALAAEATIRIKTLLREHRHILLDDTNEADEEEEAA